MEIEDKKILAEWILKIVDGDILRTRYLNGHFLEIKLKDWNPDKNHNQFKEVFDKLDPIIWPEVIKNLPDVPDNFWYGCYFMMNHLPKICQALIEVIKDQKNEN